MRATIENICKTIGQNRKIKDLFENAFRLQVFSSTSIAFMEEFPRQEAKFGKNKSDYINSILFVFFSNLNLVLVCVHFRIDRSARSVSYHGWHQSETKRTTCEHW